MSIFCYTKEQTELLAQRDGELGDFIRRKGHVERFVHDDLFGGMCYNIIGQQLSMKACETLWSKFTNTVGYVRPENCLDAELIRSCGLSASKSECIAACAREFISREISSAKLCGMADEEIISLLTKIRGIGRWTAEMVLIFCLARPDVLSLSDFGIRKGLSLLHDIDMNDRKAMQGYKELYSPCGTVASIYLWEAARDLDTKEK